MDEVLVIQHEADTGLSWMAEHLGPEVRVLRPYLGDIVPAVPQAAGLIVLGGSMAAWDDEVAPWLPATRQLIEVAVRSQVPTLGVCLGGQLLAAACGGKVERGASGLEVGPVQVTPLPAAADDPFFGRVLRALDEGSWMAESGAGLSWSVHQYHHDAVIDLPAAGEVLVTGEVYPNQGFRIGAAAWGLQYHPEASTELFATWVGHGVRSGELAPEVTELLAASRAGAQWQARLAAAHAQAFLDIVRSGSQSLG